MNGFVTFYYLGLRDWHSGLIIRKKEKEKGRKEKIKLPEKIDREPCTSIRHGKRRRLVKVRE